MSSPRRSCRRLPRSPPSPLARPFPQHRVISADCQPKKLPKKVSLFFFFIPVRAVVSCLRGCSHDSAWKEPPLSLRPGFSSVRGGGHKCSPCLQRTQGEPVVLASRLLCRLLVPMFSACGGVVGSTGPTSPRFARSSAPGKGRYTPSRNAGGGTCAADGVSSSLLLRGLPPSSRGSLLYAWCSRESGRACTREVSTVPPRRPQLSPTPVSDDYALLNLTMDRSRRYGATTVNPAL